MSKKIEVDSKKFIEMIANGAGIKELMQNFGLKTSAQVKIAYLNAVMEEGILPGIKDGRASKAEAKPSGISVTKRGSLVVPKEMVSEMGFKEGDSFATRKTKAGISLKQTNIVAVEDEPKPIIKTRKKRDQ